jgi:L-aminopeptidase/D-esterase-like protein
VGVLVQCNYGRRRRLSIAGVPVGLEITDLVRCYAGAQPPKRSWLRGLRPCSADVGGATEDTALETLGSIIIVVATDAPLLPHQLERVATRASLGVGRMGGLGENGSGDIFLAFSTANPAAASDSAPASLTMLPNDRIDPLFEATVQATEEAIINAMLAAETMTGADSIRSYALPHDRLVAALRKYNRLVGK